MVDASQPPLKITRLRKAFAGGRGLADVSLSVPAGSISAFIGANGAGKSTTFRCVLGLIRPDAGEVRLFGQPADAAGRRRVGFLAEERGLAPNDRARDVIAFNGRLKGLGRREAFAAADRLLERVGLGAQRCDRIEELSKGNAQRVQLMCALVHAPDLLILDEPLSGLDPVAQSDIISLFAEIRVGGGAILFSTHTMAAAESLCDRVVMLSAGRTVFEGPIEAVRERTAHGAVLVTTDPKAMLAAAATVGGEARLMTPGEERHDGSAQRWRVILPAQTTHPALLRALAERSAPVLSFTPIKADLEGAFWELAQAIDADATSMAQPRSAA